MPAMTRLLPKLSRRRAAADAGDDVRLVGALREGEERAFEELIERHQSAMLRVAQIYVRNRSVAEEVVQETWTAALVGIDRFEGRSSLKTWLFRILTNRAKTRAQKEGRTVPFSALGDENDSAEARWPHHWAAPPRDWRTLPEERLLSRETLELVRDAIDELPPAQQQVITLRDVEGWGSREVCDLLELSEVNQRVLLHRARSKVRQALEAHFDPEVGRA